MIQIYWCRSSIFRHLKLELLTQFPASSDEKYINVVYIWRKFVSFYGYVHWRMTTEISVTYGSEKVKAHACIIFVFDKYPVYSWYSGHSMADVIAINTLLTHDTMMIVLHEVNKRVTLQWVFSNRIWITDVIRADRTHTSRAHCRWPSCPRTYKIIIRKKSRTWCGFFLFFNLK